VSHKKYKMLLVQVVFWLAGVAVAVLSLLPVEHLPPIAFSWWDKAQHALAFGLLGCFGLLAYFSQRFYVVAGLLIFGVLIEIAQSATGWRYGDWQDALADAVGVAVAYGCVATSGRLDRWRPFT
jgi:VanZ family protein